VKREPIFQRQKYLSMVFLCMPACRQGCVSFITGIHLIYLATGALPKTSGMSSHIFKVFCAAIAFCDDLDCVLHNSNLFCPACRVGAGGVEDRNCNKQVGLLIFVTVACLFKLCYGVFNLCSNFLFFPLKKKKKKF